MLIKDYYSTVPHKNINCVVVIIRIADEPLTYVFMDKDEILSLNYHQITILSVLLVLFTLAWCSSSVGCTSAWYADGRGFNPHIRQYSFVETCDEILSTALISPYRWFK